MPTLFVSMPAFRRQSLLTMAGTHVILAPFLVGRKNAARIDGVRENYPHTTDQSTTYVGSWLNTLTRNTDSPMLFIYTGNSYKDGLPAITLSLRSNGAAEGLWSMDDTHVRRAYCE
jgi:hypothetical protein